MAEKSMIFGLGRIFGALAFLVLPVAVFAPKGLAPLFIVTALLALIALARGRRLSWPGGAIWISLAALVVIGAASGLWSATPAESLRALLSFAATMIGLFVLVKALAFLTADEKGQLATGVIWGGVAGLALLAIELTTNGAILQAAQTASGAKVDPGYDYSIEFNSATAVAAIYVWPWLLALHQRYSRWVVALGAVLAFAVVFLGRADTPFLALVVGLAGFAFVLWKAKPAFAFYAVILAAGIVSAPLIPGLFPNPLVTGKGITFMSNSAAHRLVIWNTTVRHIAERPVLGHGFDTSRAFYGQDTKNSQILFPDIPKRRYENSLTQIPLHPHNGVLQVWLELGAVGAAALLAFLLFLIAAIYREAKGAIEMAAGIGLFTTALFIGSISFGVWQSWWLGALIITGGLMRAFAGSPEPR